LLDDEEKGDDMTDNLPSASPPLRPRNRNRSEGAPTRHGQLHSRHPLATAAKWLAAVVGVLAVSTASVAAFAIYDTVSNSKPGIHLATLPGTKAKPVPDIGERPRSHRCGLFPEHDAPLPHVHALHLVEGNRGEPATERI